MIIGRVVAKYIFMAWRNLYSYSTDDTFVIVEYPGLEEHFDRII